MRATLTPAMLDAARQAQESIMFSHGVIRTPGDGWVFNPDTGQDEPAQGEVVYEGPMRIQARSADTEPVLVAGQPMARPGYVGAVPWHVTGLQPGQTVEVTESGEAVFPRRFVITGIEANGLAVTARRFFATLLDEEANSDR